MFKWLIRLYRTCFNPNPQLGQTWVLDGIGQVKIIATEFDGDCLTWERTLNADQVSQCRWWRKAMKAYGYLQE